MRVIGIIQKLVSVPYLMRHPAVPRWLKALPYLAFIYLIFPRDLIVDFRVFGLLDDLIVVSLLLSIFISRAERYVYNYDHHRDGSIDADFKVLIEEEQAKARGETPPRGRTKTKSRPAPPDHTPKDDLRSRP